MLHNCYENAIKFEGSILRGPSRLQLAEYQLFQYKRRVAEDETNYFYPTSTQLFCSRMPAPPSRGRR